MGLNPRHPKEDPFWTLGPLFEQTKLRTARQCYIPNFKQLSLEKRFFKFILNKFGKGQLNNATYPGFILAPYFCERKSPIWSNIVRDFHIQWDFFSRLRKISEIFAVRQDFCLLFVYIFSLLILYFNSGYQVNKMETE